MRFHSSIKKYSRLCILLVMLCMGGRMTAQVQVTQKIDSVSILIGQQTRLLLSVSLPKGWVAEFPSFKDSVMITPGVEVIDQNDLAKQDIGHGMQRLQRVYTLTSFEQDLYRIPALDVKVKDEKYHGNELALKVITVPVDTIHPDQFYPQKPVQDNPFQSNEWLPLYFVSILMLLVIGVAIFLIARLRSNKPIHMTFKMVKRIPAHTKALREIEVIKQEHPENQEGQKIYYTRLTETIRKYIESRFGFSAMEMTSSQIIEELRAKGDEKMIDELKGLFQTADLVKFAKYETLINENDYNLVNAVKFIDETKTDETEIVERVAPKLSEDDKKHNSQRLIMKVLIAATSLTAVGLLAWIIYRVSMLTF